MPDVQRCIAVPSVPLPALPPGLSFTIPGISVAFNPKFCCKLPSFNKSLLTPTPINSLFFAPIAKALKAIMAQLNSYISLLAIPCPRL